MTYICRSQCSPDVICDLSCCPQGCTWWQKAGRMSRRSGYLFHTPTKKDQRFWSQRSFRIHLDMPDMGWIYGQFSNWGRKRKLGSWEHTRSCWPRRCLNFPLYWYLTLISPACVLCSLPVNPSMLLLLLISRSPLYGVVQTTFIRQTYWYPPRWWNVFDSLFSL